MKAKDFKASDRVELHPGCDLWMRGARFGNVRIVGRKWVHVSLDMLPGRVLRFDPSRLTLIAR